MSKALWLAGAGAAGSTPHQASVPSQRTPAGDGGPEGTRSCLPRGFRCQQLCWCNTPPCVCHVIWYVGSFLLKNGFILLSAAFLVATVGSAPAASSRGFPAWFTWGEPGRGERRFLILSVLLPGRRLALVCTGRERAVVGCPSTAAGCSPHVLFPGCPDPAEDAAGQTLDTCGMSPSVLCCPAPRGPCWRGGGCAQAPYPACSPTPGQEGLPALRAAPPAAGIWLHPGKPRRGQGCFCKGAVGSGGGRGLGWSCPMARWGWGSVPAPAQPAGTHALPARVRALPAVEMAAMSPFLAGVESRLGCCGMGRAHFTGPGPWGAA